MCVSEDGTHPGILRVHGGRCGKMVMNQWDLVVISRKSVCFVLFCCILLLLFPYVSQFQSFSVPEVCCSTAVETPLLKPPCPAVGAPHRAKTRHGSSAPEMYRRGVKPPGASARWGHGWRQRISTVGCGPWLGLWLLSVVIHSYP